MRGIFVHGKRSTTFKRKLVESTTTTTTTNDSTNRINDVKRRRQMISQPVVDNFTVDDNSKKRARLSTTKNDSIPHNNNNNARSTTTATTSDVAVVDIGEAKRNLKANLKADIASMAEEISTKRRRLTIEQQQQQQQQRQSSSSSQTTKENDNEPLTPRLNVATTASQQQLRASLRDATIRWCANARRIANDVNCARSTNAISVDVVRSTNIVARLATHIPRNTYVSEKHFCCRRHRE